MKTFEEIYQLREDYPYKKNDQWDEDKLNRWIINGKKDTSVSDLKQLVSGYDKEYLENYDNIEERFYLTKYDTRFYYVELSKRKDYYQLYIMDADTKKIIKEYRTDDEEHCGAVMEYLFGD